MQKLAKVLVIVFVLLVGAVGAAIFSVVPVPTLTELILFYHIRHKQSEGEKFVRFKSVTELLWDKVCVLKPYSVSRLSPRETLEQYIQADLDGASLDFNASEDNAWAFVFIANNKIVRTVNTHGQYRFRMDGKENCLGQDAGLQFSSDRGAKITNIPGE
jgi:hypothetical protein